MKPETDCFLIFCGIQQLQRTPPYFKKEFFNALISNNIKLILINSILYLSIGQVAFFRSSNRSPPSNIEIFRLDDGILVEMLKMKEGNQLDI